MGPHKEVKVDSTIPINEQITEAEAIGTMALAKRLAKNGMIPPSEEIDDGFVARLQSTYWFFCLRDGAKYPVDRVVWFVVLNEEQWQEINSEDAPGVDFDIGMCSGLMEVAQINRRVYVSSAEYAEVRERMTAMAIAREVVPNTLFGDAGLFTMVVASLMDSGYISKWQAEEAMRVLNAHPEMGIGILATTIGHLAQTAKDTIKQGADADVVRGSAMVVLDFVTYPKDDNHEDHGSETELPN